MDIFERIMQWEGGGKFTNDPSDSGGRTQFGISERSHPQAWADGAVTEAEARSIFISKYVNGPKFNKIPDSHKAVREQLIDFGFLSGPQLAIMKLQAVLGLKADGALGPVTLNALVSSEPRALNNKLARERLLMLARIVQKAPSQARFLVGWLDRALSYLV